MSGIVKRLGHLWIVRGHSIYVKIGKLNDSVSPSLSYSSWLLVFNTRENRYEGLKENNRSNCVEGH